VPRIRSLRGFFGVSGILLLLTPAWSLEQEPYLQTNISAAKIVEGPQGYTVDVKILASDFEEMFQNTMAERRGVDLSGPGLLEVEIGRFVAKRVVMRDSDGRLCQSKVNKAGEDPANDEGVRVSLTFECISHDVLYDASQFLSAQGARAWQVVTIIRGDKQRRVMIKSESPPTPLNASQ
jgi:hypothetical protein